MAIHVINEINFMLWFLYRQNRFLNFPLYGLPCSAMIQTFLDYACNACYQNMNKKLKMRLQAAQNKYTRFCLKMNDRSNINSKDFEKINWLPIHKRASQCSLCSIYKDFTKNCDNYFDEIYVSLETYGVYKCSPYQKLNVPHLKTNVGHLFKCRSLTLEQFQLQLV